MVRAISQVVTVGDFLGQVRATTTSRGRTFDDYCRNFRRIVSGIFDLDGGVQKYDYRKGGRGIGYSHYRCKRIFAPLNSWLRSHGVSSYFPLHTLRKEYGSEICAKLGIYAASRALRHSDIAITSQHYLDKKKPTTIGMGHLLKAPNS